MGYLLPTDAKLRVRNNTNAVVHSYHVDRSPGRHHIIAAVTDDFRFSVRIEGNANGGFEERAVKAIIAAVNAAYP